MIIRKDVLKTDRDPKAVKWSLIAAAFALSLGCYAELVMTADAQETEASVMVGEAAQQELPQVSVRG
jgi:hypothetical protein